MEGGIRYAFAHRILAASVAILILALALWQQAAEARAWVRRLGWTAVATVLAQAALGGAMVKLADPKTLSIAHACLAQLCFGFTVAIVVANLPGVPRARAGASPAMVPLLAAGALFVQTILGAACGTAPWPLCLICWAPASPARWPCGPACRC